MFFLLAMNNPNVVEVRQSLIEEGLFPVGDRGPDERIGKKGEEKIFNTVFIPQTTPGAAEPSHPAGSD